MILATVIEGTLRCYHRSERGALTMVAQLAGAVNTDPTTVATIVSDLEKAFDWTPMEAVPPKRALPRPATKKRAKPTVRRTREQIAELEQRILELLADGPSTMLLLANACGVPDHVIKHRVDALAARGQVVRTEFLPGRFHYHLAEGGDDGQVGADEPRDGVELGDGGQVPG
jgi:hypothetical protein